MNAPKFALLTKNPEIRGYAYEYADGMNTGLKEYEAYSAMFAYLDPGDQVLIPDPNFSQYADVATVIAVHPHLANANEFILPAPE